MPVPASAIEEPAVLQGVIVRIARGAGFERHRRVDRRLHADRRLPGLTVHDDLGVVVRLGGIFDGPVHPGREIVLKRRPPAPDRCLIRRVGLAVDAGHRILRIVATGKRVAALRPEGAGLAVERPPHVAPAPPAVRRAHEAREAVVDQAEEGRRIALVDAARNRIQLAELSLAPDIGVHPGVGEGREVRARRVLVEAIAADAGPGGVRVLVPIGRRRQRDVVQRWKLAPNPRARIVLIGNRVDAQLARRSRRARPAFSSPSPVEGPVPACSSRPRRAPRAAGRRASPPIE